MTSLFLSEGVWARNNTTLSSQYFTGCQCVPTRANTCQPRQLCIGVPGNSLPLGGLSPPAVGNAQVAWSRSRLSRCSLWRCWRQLNDKDNNAGNNAYQYRIHYILYIYMCIYTYLYKLPSSFWHVTTAACLGMSFVSHELKPAEHFHWAWWRCSWFPRWLSLWRPFLVAQPSAVIKLSFWERKTLGPSFSLWCSQRESQVGHSVGPENSLECCFFCLDCLEC